MHADNPDVSDTLNGWFLQTTMTRLFSCFHLALSIEKSILVDRRVFWQNGGLCYTVPESLHYLCHWISLLYEFETFNN